MEYKIKNFLRSKLANVVYENNGYIPEVFILNEENEGSIENLFQGRMKDIDAVPFVGTKRK